MTTSEILFKKTINEATVTVDEDSHVLVSWPGVKIQFVMDLDGGLSRPIILEGPRGHNIARAQGLANKALSWRPRAKDMVWGRFAPAD